MVIKEQLAESQGICEYAVYVQGLSACFAYFSMSVAESDQFNYVTPAKLLGTAVWHHWNVVRLLLSCFTKICAKSLLLIIC